MMLGYLCDKHNVTDINVDKMAEFFGKYTVNWKKTNGKTITIDKVAKHGR